MECITVGVVCCVKAVMLIWGAKPSDAVAAQYVMSKRSTQGFGLHGFGKLVKTGEPITDQSLINYFQRVGRARKTLNSIIGSF